MLDVPQGNANVGQEAAKDGAPDTLVTARLTPYYDDLQVAFYHGDVMDVLRKLPDGAAQMCVTSPPYWGLRDYGTATWEGGDVECGHEPNVAPRDSRPKGSLVGSTATVDAGTVQRDCHCGARRIDQQLGLEATPEEFITKMVAVFHEVRRVMRDDGVCWINIGDSYASNPASGGSGQQGGGDHQQTPRGEYRRPSGLKPKDLVGIPWMLAFALRADGWYLRQDIIWAKPNPMPESVTDRCTKSHEYLFLLSKSARYYYDADAIAEQTTDLEYRTVGKIRPTADPLYAQTGDAGAGRYRANLDTQAGGRTTRNKRSVWTIATEAYPDAHFATYPTALVTPCVLAGTSERGCCAECGAPWERVTERSGGERYATGKSATKNASGLVTAFSGYKDGSSAPTFTTTGWRATCAHADAPTVPCTVLDPFLGSGTTAWVAKSLGRKSIGIDLSAEYLDLAIKRNQQMGMVMS